MRILTWNILSSEWEPEMGKFNKRKLNIKKILTNGVYDIILLQEVDRMSYRFLKKELSMKYWMSKMSVIEWDDNPEIQTGNVILVRKKWKGSAKVKEVEIDLNDGGILMIVLKEYVIVNIHLTTKSSFKRLRDIRYINMLIEERYPNYRVILGGDFNNNLIKTKRIHQYLLRQGYDNSTNRKVRTTYLPYRAVIDFIYIKGKVKKVKGNVMDTDKNKRLRLKELGSDHYPVLANLTL